MLHQRPLPLLRGQQQNLLRSFRVQFRGLVLRARILRVLRRQVLRPVEQHCVQRPQGVLRNGAVLRVQQQALLGYHLGG